MERREEKNSSWGGGTICKFKANIAIQSERLSEEAREDTSPNPGFCKIYPLSLYIEREALLM